MEFVTNTYTPAPDKPSRVKRQKCGPGTMQPRKTVTKPLIFPQLLEASAFVNDPEWVALLQNAARGDFVNKFIRYDGKTMCKTDTCVREQMPSDPKQLAARFILFHKRHEGISTKHDTESQDKRRDDISDQNIELTWDVCHKTMKTSRLVDFAKRKCDTTAEVDAMLAVLYTANVNKILTRNTVTMCNNSIVSISVIDHDTESNQWYIRS